jgi:hypothetical protein
MNIEGLGNRYGFGLQGEKKSRTEGAQENAAMKRQEHPPEGTAQPKTEQKNHHQEAHGAIRNLQEGHYQGVASLRLQINFHEQLQATTMQKADDVLAAGSDTLVAGLKEQVTTLGGEFQGTFGDDFQTKMQGMMETFSQAVNTLFGTTGETETASTPKAVSKPGDIFTGIRQAFDVFFTAMLELDQPPTDESVPVDTDLEPALAVENTESPDIAAISTTDAAEGGIADINTAETVDELMAAAPAITPENSQPPLSFTDRLTEVRTWFEAQLGSLQSSVDDLLQLPPVAPPQGHGMAYSRFLAIYTEMNSTGATTQPGSEMASGGGLATEA